MKKVMVSPRAFISTIALGFLLCILVVWVFLPNSNQNKTGSATNPTWNQNVVEPSNPIINQTEGQQKKDTTMTFVTKAKELHSALNNSVKGSTIELAEGVYIGQFKMDQDSLALRGKGPGTIIKLNAGVTKEDLSWVVALNISGNNCHISKLKLLSLSHFNYTEGIEIHGEGNSLSEVQFEGLWLAGSALGEDTKFSNISIKDCDYGIHITANGNRLDSIKMENVSLTGVSIYGNNNTLHSYTCDDCKKALTIGGDHNLVHNVESKHPKLPTSYLPYTDNTEAIEFYGSGNIISEIVLEGFETAAVIYFGQDNKLSNISIKGCGYGIKIHASGNSLASIKVENVSVYGVANTGNNNKFHSYTCDDCQKAVLIWGDYNLVQNVETRHPKDSEDMSSGIFIGKGEGNVVDTFTGSEYGVTLGATLWSMWMLEDSCGFGWEGTE